MSDVDLGSRFLRWERRDAVAWVTIDRPERRNALTANMYFGIRRAVDRVNTSRSLHALVITGTGDVFAPGGELGASTTTGSSTSERCSAPARCRSTRSATRASR